MLPVDKRGSPFHNPAQIDTVLAGRSYRAMRPGYNRLSTHEFKGETLVRYNKVIETLEQDKPVFCSD